jgi:hypothetical protein
VATISVFQHGSLPRSTNDLRFGVNFINSLTNECMWVTALRTNNDLLPGNVSSQAAHTSADPPAFCPYVTDIVSMKTNASTLKENLSLHVRYSPQITSWSLRGVNNLSAVRGSTQHAGGRKTYWSAIRRRRLTVNIGHFKHCNSLVHFVLWWVNVFTLDSSSGGGVLGGGAGVTP